MSRQIIHRTANQLIGNSVTRFFDLVAGKPGNRTTEKLTSMLAKTNKYFLIRLIMVFCLCGLSGFASAQRYIDPSDIDLTGQQTRGFNGHQWLVDVRTPREYEAKHIEGAVNIPAFVIDAKGLPKEDRIIVYCNDVSGRASRGAAEKLVNAGYQDVAILRGGLLSWQIAKRPIAKPLGILKTPLVDFVTPSDLYELQRLNLRDAQIIDIRSNEMFQKGHIQGSSNMPSLKKEGQVSKSNISLGATSNLNVNLPLVFVDGGDETGIEQAENLRRQGFLGARYLEGGYVAWELFIKKIEAKEVHHE